jgi:ankyrin repeat protein
VTGADGFSPLALACRLSRANIMEILLKKNPENDDGSLHDAAANLHCDAMDILIKHGHHIDYPSERHDGRSALAELCLNCVNRTPKPEEKEIHHAVKFLMDKGCDLGLQCLSEDKTFRTILHFALDSSDPMLILPALFEDHVEGNPKRSLSFPRLDVHLLTHHVCPKRLLQRSPAPKRRHSPPPPN